MKVETGTVKNINGVFYAESKNGESRFLKVGDTIAQGDKVVGNNADNALVISSIDGSNSYFLNGNNTFVFDTSTIENTFGIEETTFSPNVLFQVDKISEYSILDETQIEEIGSKERSQDEDLKKDTAEEDTAEENQVAQSNDYSGMIDFVARDLGSIDVSTLSLLKDASGGNGEAGFDFSNIASITTTSVKNIEKLEVNLVNGINDTLDLDQLLSQSGLTNVDDIKIKGEAGDAIRGLGNNWNSARTQVEEDGITYNIYTSNTDSTVTLKIQEDITNII